MVEQHTVNVPVGGSIPSWGAKLGGSMEDYDWDKHAANKQAARDKDAEDIKNGVPVEVIRERNFMFSGIDMSKCVAISPCGTRFKPPIK